ncbi:MAG: hypothetical protein AB7V14_01815 [Kiritimatiellia bacterium]
MSTSESTAELQEPGGRCMVGVHLDIDSLRVAAVIRGRVVRWASVPYPDGVQPGSKDFPAFLKTGMADFHSAFSRASLWVVGPLPSLQVRFLSLPKGRPRQLSNLVYWTFRKEIPFDPVQTVFDYGVEGDLSASGQSKKTDVTAYTVARGDVDALVDTFDRAGLRVEGIVLPSFALRNLLGARPPAHRGPELGLYVGGDASSLLFFKGKRVVAHRVFKTGMNVMLDVLRDRYPDWSPAKTYQAIRAVLVSAAFPEPRSGERGSDEASQIIGTVRVAFDRLVQQVERSMSAYLVGKSEEEIANVYVAGSMAGLPTLVQELGSKLGLASRPLDLFRPDLMEAKGLPPAGPEEGGMMAIALGAALSDPAQTPNLLHTYVQRAKEARCARCRTVAAVLGIVGLALLLAGGVLIGHRNRRLQTELDDLQSQIRQFAPYPDRAMIQRMVDQAATDSLQMKGMAGRSLPVAALNQLALGTPEDIRLTSIAMERYAEVGTGKKPKKTAASGAGSSPEIRIRMQGMVRGAPGSQESKLAAYVLRLEDAEMFEGVSLNRSEEGREGGEQVLLFDLDMGMDDFADPPAPDLAPMNKEGVAP